MRVKAYECPRDIPCVDNLNGGTCDRIVKIRGDGYLISLDNGEYFASCPYSDFLESIRKLDIKTLDDIDVTGGLVGE